MILGKDMTCENCMFWQALKETIGVCHQSSPRVELRQLEYATWPKTMNYDWCGDYKCNSELEKKLHEQAKKEAAEFGKIIGDTIREITHEAISEEEKN